jgi:hypothetical protein
MWLPWWEPGSWVGHSKLTVVILYEFVVLREQTSRSKWEGISQLQSELQSEFNNLNRTWGGFGLDH